MYFLLDIGFLWALLFQIVCIGSQLTEAFAGLDRMHEVMSEVPEDIDPERTETIGVIQGQVSLKDVDFEYENGKPVLHGVSLDAFPGTMTALVGPSGSGKSTLIGLIAGIAKPRSGIITVDGVDISKLRLDSFRSQLG